ncbi:single-stranded-DNA-specific exonuclease RecJ [Cohnella sp. AR92]|uniref:single-stranded-DNA-specific exonuclease RecJ n=1 Tax=Cohnella sp. AR92 TaxID=648716 RepID=UPI000F8E7DFA|nr:single-stranded-DNA-specific exonuclease RecJ [Cohnella sp. AR92]RUS47705.1 single-stranded-DNA-specific exonuclease RecJ [Cohnella sp. AR92]
MRRSYRWLLRETDERETEALVRELKLPPMVARLLVSRGYRTPGEARALLSSEAESFHDPFRMKGMQAATERIHKALRDREKIRVYGDYDADGVTSTALMTRLLMRLGASFDTYIPHRSLEGYGLNLKAVDLAAEAGIGLIITVDNGISASEQIAYARERGIDVVVTDHHEPPEKLPEAAIALVNPKQEDCPYPFKGLSGAGVAFKLAHAMLGTIEPAYADVAAIGTVADLMPLTGENRAIVKLGLSRMVSDPAPGIRALAEASGTDYTKLTSGRIGFGLAPRLNAGGRLERADGAVRLLVTEDEEEARMLSLKLDELNKERQQLVEDTVVQAEELWQAKIAEHEGRMPEAIVLAGDGWNAGIAGLVASKLVERYYRPVIILAHDPATGKCKGSARSIEGFNLYDALTECSDLMDHFGGHEAAAGMTLPYSNVPELGERLSELAKERISAEDWIPSKKADLVCSMNELTLEAADQLNQLEPFGNGNPTPRIVIRGVSIAESKTLGKEGTHVRFVAVSQGRRLETVGFGMADSLELFRSGAELDLLGELSVNEWNGSRRVQFMLQDFKKNQPSVRDCRQEKLGDSVAVRLAEEGRKALFLYSSAAGRIGLENLDGISPAGINAAVYSALGDREDSAIWERLEASASASSNAGAEEGWTLVLAGLPRTTEEAEALRAAVARNSDKLEEIRIYLAESDRSSERKRSFPDRTQFGKVYTMFRKQERWIDAPDGFLRKVSEASGWPLATVRMMQEVFLELGFLTANRSNIDCVASPPKRELDRSERYRKAKEQAELSELAELPLQQFKKWLFKQGEG